MLKAIGTAEGQPALVLGLTRRNLELLEQGKPITFNVRDVHGGADLPALYVTVFFAEDNRRLLAVLREQGMLEPNAIARIGPATHGVEPDP